MMKDSCFFLNSDFVDITTEAGIYKDYTLRMSELFKQNKILHKNLIEEKVKTFPSIYSKSRVMPDGQFENVPFYVYGNKLAIILWGGKIKIICINNAELANAYRKIFEFVWNQSKSVLI